MNLSKELTDIQKQMSPDSLTNECGGEGCRVYRADIPKKRVVINIEKEFDTRRDHRKRADRLLFYGNASKNTFVAVPIELKSGKADESDVREKLENSLNFAATLAPDRNECGETVYVPVLFHGRGINRTNPRSRRQFTVNFQGKSVRVLIGRCGRKRNLANLLSEAGYL
ncbi:hypothetical protein C6499_12150 [Candidatus Poribacteria bacterium]|nr:MAG: hypothetical protein C6499_12150 [Candidatus Poribacteria bacterium]